MFVPEDFKGKLLVNSYLNSKPGRGSSKWLREKVLAVPGSRSSIVKYLAGRGRNKIPELVGRHFDGHWYAGPAKLLAKTHLADGMIIDKILDNMAPSTHGTNDLAKSFIYAGGMV